MPYVYILLSATESRNSSDKTLNLMDGEIRENHNEKLVTENTLKGEK